MRLPLLPFISSAGARPRWTTYFILNKPYDVSPLDELEKTQLGMEEANRVASNQLDEESILEATQSIKNHWPTWAIVLVIVCIVLTALAFLLGNFITKKATPIRFKGQSANVGKTRERKWGAGFSGGMWAAA